MTLVAALLLLEPPTSSSVYLMSCAYLQNWLRWAFNQPVVPGEMDRVKQALQAAADVHQMDLIVDEYTDPGPIDNRDLSMPGHALLLRPQVQVGQLQLPPLSMGITRQRNNSIISGSTTTTNGHGNPAEEEDVKISCSVVPERFYEVRIYDGYSASLVTVVGCTGICSKVSWYISRDSPLSLDSSCCDRYME